MKLWIKQSEMKRKLKEKVSQALQSEDGQGMVEYGLILALVAVVVIVALTGIGTNIKAKFENIQQNLQ